MSWTREQCVNSKFCLLHSKFMCMNSMGYSSYTLKKRKKKANAELKTWIQTDTKVQFGLGLFMSAFYSFTFLPFFFSFFFFYQKLVSLGEQTYQWVSCTVHGTHQHFGRPHIGLKWHCLWVLCIVHGTYKYLFSPKL